jgi:hypothetical protein
MLTLPVKSPPSVIVRADAHLVAVAALPVVLPELPDTLPVTLPKKLPVAVTLLNDTLSLVPAA